jgi:hypothetical protein
MLGIILLFDGQATATTICWIADHQLTGLDATSKHWSLKLVCS